MEKGYITIEGARQNNLKGIDIRLPLNEFTVVTGVSGSGKSSLAFDTVYAEGQRRYVETFSPYARQFLDRMDKPKVSRIEGILPAIAINQVNPIKTSRSTVGTMTEINDYMKLLFARAGQLHCRRCGKHVTRDTEDTIYEKMLLQANGQSVMITFPVSISKDMDPTIIADILKRQGFSRIYINGEVLDIREDRFEIGIPQEIKVIFDRILLQKTNKTRIIDSLEGALRFGKGRLSILFREGEELKFSTYLHCPDCNIDYEDPTPNLFSFNSPIGACPTCHGFGRTIEIDLDLVIPDKTKSLRDGAIKPWTTESYFEEFQDLLEFCKRYRIPVDTPYYLLTSEQKRMIIEGTPSFYGIKGFFNWLERKTYKMHIRILLSKYRTYVTCRSCHGSRFKDETLLYRLGGKTISQIYELPIAECYMFFCNLKLTFTLDEATKLLVNEIKSRLRYLVDVGLGYLTLSRQSRTLSGGEVERVSLTSALGSSLVNTLYVLDEPSIGLHPRDTSQLIHVLHNLRDRGNTILVVEHDRDIIQSSDNIIDLGPGPGEQGGEVIFSGKPKDFITCKRSLTSQYLSFKELIPVPKMRRTIDPNRVLKIRGATHHNLKNIDVTIPLDVLVCVTGVSGSGKSTLIEEVLYRNLRRIMGDVTPEPGSCKEIIGADLINGVILVSQSPIGKTPRSNPVTYVKAFDSIRRCFASSDLSKQRGYTPSTFSFNVPGGRCEVCNGAGFEQVEMQFLSTVFISCPECLGKRYNSDVLQVKYNGVDISQVMEMTVLEAREFFGYTSDIAHSLLPLEEVGLGYIRLGQPINTLSGGEAQRLKLASHIASARKQNLLFIFDEPTTGLHPHDIKTLLACFKRLIDHKNTVLVVEHNLDVIKCADYLIDLGPEGGEEGGEVVITGPPEEIIKCPRSHTGRFLKSYLSPKKSFPIQKGEIPIKLKKEFDGKEMSIIGAKEHNLKDINIRIPRDKITVITGISGSGKSTLAFDILFAEGQRRYLDSLSAYARQYIKQLKRPDVAYVKDIPPTVAIEQRISRGGRKSTVATITEIYHFLRLIYAKIGIQYCPRCKVKVEMQTQKEIVRQVLDNFKGEDVSFFVPIVRYQKGFHKEVFSWARKKGFDLIRVDGTLFSTQSPPTLSRYQEHNLEILLGRLKVEEGMKSDIQEMVERALSFGNGTFLLSTHLRPDVIYSTRRACPKCNRSFPELDPRMFSFNSRLGACETCNGLGVVGGYDKGWEEETDGLEEVCPTCNGLRLKEDSLWVKVSGRSISDFTSLSVDEMQNAIFQLRLSEREKRLSSQALEEIEMRLRFLKGVGLSYITLSRSADTLSSGEAQRLRLAAQLGGNLRGVCYILDEPTIGLHPRDNEMLIDTLHELKRKGNTVVIVEHDEYTIRRADWIIDLGPGGGVHGGYVVSSGTLKDILDSKSSKTAKFLKNPLSHRLLKKRRDLEGVDFIEVLGAKENNLKDIDVKIPLSRLVCVTGVSGAGKSTLVREVLYKGLLSRITKRHIKPGSHKALIGVEKIERVLEVTQSPIGRTPRSIPATYVGFFDEIRRIFSKTPEARIRGYSPSRFSFNVQGGRCERCKGEGRLKIEMSFLPNVYIQCDECSGKRYNQETLAITFKGKNISDVLSMTVDEAYIFFSAMPKLRRPLEILHEIGLGYIQLGQTSPTLSGGEAQRIKLVAELAKVSKGRTLYILEEPTTGLHTEDIDKLLKILHRLVDKGNTVIVIEHNLDVISEADYVIDLGPEGGMKGGQVVAEGTPEDIIKSVNGSYTACFLKRFHKERKKED
ncbi:MAG: excinuclease ABC subunit UvrA [bacterium]|nr:excinuclease ABC subunit UvrA [bacterium]